MGRRRESKTILYSTFNKAGQILMGTITNKQCILKIKEKLGMEPEDVKRIIQEFLEISKEYLLNGDRIEIRNFGIFKIVIKKKMIGRNPRKPEKAIVIPERMAIKFTPSEELKYLVERKNEE